MLDPMTKNDDLGIMVQVGREVPLKQVNRYALAVALVSDLGGTLAAAS
jgi:hypothetical protein